MPATDGARLESPGGAVHWRGSARRRHRFRSYEPGRSQYVTFLANYFPFEDPQGGPNFYNLDDKAIYAINVDNDGSGRPDLTFEFRFKNTTRNLAVPAGGQTIAVPLINIGPVDLAGANLNVTQSYTLMLVRHGNRGDAQPVENESLERNTFYKPADNIGHKSIPDYPAYADSFTTLKFPVATHRAGCSSDNAKKDSSSALERSSIW